MTTAAPPGGAHTTLVTASPDASMYSTGPTLELHVPTAIACGDMWGWMSIAVLTSHNKTVDWHTHFQRCRCQPPSPSSPGFTP